MHRRFRFRAEETPNLSAGSRRGVAPLSISLPSAANPLRCVGLPLASAGLGLSIKARSTPKKDRVRKWRRAIVGWARLQAVEPIEISHLDGLSQEVLLSDAFDLSKPDDQYLHSLLSPFRDEFIELAKPDLPIASGNRTGEGRELVPTQSSGGAKGESKSGSAVSHIAGHAITGKYYAPRACAECAMTLPWEPQCPACTAAFDSLTATARADAGVAHSEPDESIAQAQSDLGLRNTDVFEEFMSRQVALPLVEPGAQNLALQGP